MQIFGIPVNFLNSILPALIVIIGATSDVHFVHEFRDHLRQGMNGAAAMQATVKSLSLPMMLTSCTTVLGFATTALSELPILRGHLERPADRNRKPQSQQRLTHHQPPSEPDATLAPASGAVNGVSSPGSGSHASPFRPTPTNANQKTWGPALAPPFLSDGPAGQGDDRLHRDARRRHVQQQEGDPLLRLAAGVGAHQAEHPVGELRMGRPDF